MATARAFVSGSTGLLGNNLVRELLDRVFAARFTRRTVLVRVATIRVLARVNDRSRFDHTTSQRDPAIAFRAVSETIRDTVAWFRSQGRISA